MAQGDNETTGSPSPGRVVSYFVRHGSTELNDDHRFRGPLDPELDDHGLADANELSQFFSGIKLGSAWTSDRRRTETTARAVLQPKGMNYQPDARLRAWNVGFLGGRKKDDHQDDIDYFQRNPDVEIPQGESLNSFKDRVRPAILEALQAGISQPNPSIVFAHSSVLKEVSNMLHGDHNFENVGPGGVIGIYQNADQFNVKALYKPRPGQEGYGH